jgi:aminopeptidase-like protein
MRGSEDRGQEMMNLANRLWPINRSLSGPGVRETLEILKTEIPNLELLSVASGTQVFDWITPQEWAATSAYIITPDGKRICDFEENNLHLVGYSEPFEGELTLDELSKHLYYLEDQPDAIPYVTSYYKRDWGFCISANDRKELIEGTYKVYVRSTLEPGFLNFGELVLPGTSNREVFFSTYICHPSMANNELSGPVLATALAKYLEGLPRYYTYRFVFIPETIGSLVYLSQNLEKLKASMLAGYVLTCVGDERTYSYVPSRSGSTVADKAALRSTSMLGITPQKYSWLDRGSDERQYCSPGVDLPVCSLMRSKYGSYPEYHTNLDKLGTVVTSQGLSQSFDLYKQVVADLESRRYPKSTHQGEPQMGRRNLYPHISIKRSISDFDVLMNVLSLSDGTLDIDEIAQSTDLSIKQVSDIIELLLVHNLISI